MDNKQVEENKQRNKNVILAIEEYVASNRISTKKALAEKMGVGMDQFTRLKNGGNVTDEFIDKFYKATGGLFNLGWLTGTSNIMYDADVANHVELLKREQEEGKLAATQQELIESLKRELAAKQILIDSLVQQVADLRVLIPLTHKEKSDMILSDGTKMVYNPSKEDPQRKQK
jgi:hypothetical protein